MIRTTIISVGLLLTAFSLLVPAGSAETCDPQTIVCTGDGSDPFAHCDGTWVDAFGAGFGYAQVCTDGDSVHYVVCADANTNCDEYLYNHQDGREPCGDGENVCMDGDL